MPELEPFKSLSQSLIWDLLKDSYRNSGIEAWNRDNVPLHRSSNSFIARRYAEVIRAFGRDCQALSTLGASEPSQPMVILEIGAGAGRLSYLILRHLQRLNQEHGSPEAGFKLVLTDIAPANIDAWKASRAFDADIECGLVDFAVFDADRPGELRLHESGDVLSNGVFSGPLVLIANYVLDSLRQDQFRFEHGRLWECLVAVTVPDSLDIEQTIPLKEVSLAHREIESHLPHYADDRFDPLLEHYADALEEGEILLPVGMQNCLDHLRQFSTGPSLSLIGDLGFRFTDEWKGRRIPPFRSDLSNYFWMTGNLDALTRITTRRGGLAMVSDEPDEHFVICALLEDIEVGPNSETRRAFENSIRHIGPSEIREIIKPLIDIREQLSPITLLYILRLSEWDPRTLLEFGPGIVGQPKAWTGRLRHHLVEALRCVGDNHYPLGNPADFAIVMAHMFLMAGEPVEAKKWAFQSIDEHGDTVDALLFLAECYRSEKNASMAEHFEKKAHALRLEADEAMPFVGDVISSSLEAKRASRSAQLGPFAAPSSRNAPCPCGSGRKFKHCHGRSQAGQLAGLKNPPLPS